MGFAHILDEFRSIVRQELAALLQTPHAASKDEVGGTDLAVEITRLSSHGLQRMDGAYLRGMAYKEAKPFAELTLMEEKFPEVEACIAQHLTGQQKEQVAHLTQLIEGFESPLGMELLATVDYLLDAREADDLPTLVQAVGAWNERKRKVLTPEYIGLAFERLSLEGV